MERTPALRAGGTGVDVRDDAVAVVERMGLMARVRELAADVHGMKFVDAADRAVARLGTRDPGAVEIMRGDLVALLHEATPDVEVLFGDAIRALEQDGDGVAVAFTRLALLKAAGVVERRLQARNARPLRDYRLSTTTG
ncbi:hypothetical protein [Actinomadura hibisca]|uniref:hypothetical protein n=1 Tax=Actinomadura hibisca TaxID=68565 RepID=UPI000ACA2BFE|nr:hypothetical protein [Actinomadura hibisca]